MESRAVSIPKPEIAAMARKNDLDSKVETDNRQSISYIQQDETTFNTRERQIAFGTKTFEQKLSPEVPREQNQLQLSAIQEDNLYQCAGAESNSWSDSGEEESSPYSSLGVEKYEAQVPSNRSSEWRKKRETPLANMEVTESHAAASAPNVVQTQQNTRLSGIYMQESNDGYWRIQTIIPTGSLKENPVVRKYK